jgi:hypothetical protein
MRSITCGLRSCAFLAVTSVLLIPGCGDDSGLAKRYSVSGTVTYQGKNVEKGTITFKPDDPAGRTASGDIKDGSYSLTTATPGDGALPGKYKISIVAVDVDTTELKAIAKGGQFHHDKAFGKANKNAKQLVPPKFGAFETSGLTFEVKTGSNTYNADLKD